MNKLPFIFLMALSGSLLADQNAPGGSTTVDNVTSLAFSQPAENLPDERLKDFFVGNSFFKNNWVQSPASAEARDGLGPHYIARSCSSCHLLDGRGKPPNESEQPVSLLLKTRAWQKSSHSVTAHPELGEQLTIRAAYDQRPEAFIQIEYQTEEGRFTDGSSYQLRYPDYKITLASKVDVPMIISPRVAPQVIGLGLLEAIAEDTLKQWQSNSTEGISGRINWVNEPQIGRKLPGRFGWKAAATSVMKQTAGALNNDIGITSSLFPITDRDGEYNEVEVEISDKLLKQLTFYSMTLAVPALRDDDVELFTEGQSLFRSAGCNECHIESTVTGSLPDFPELSQQSIHAYTDLLLHDMGKGLADQYFGDKPESETMETKRFRQEWKTPPLWGIGLIKKVNGHSQLLHDGRARDINEAILWHGGEAELTKLHYLKMPKAKRAALLYFLNAI